MRPDRPGRPPARPSPPRTRRRGFTLGVVASAAAMLAYGCVDRQVVAVTVGTVVVAPEITRVFTGDTAQVTAQVSDVEGRLLRRALVVWESDDPDVVTVDGEGMVVAVSADTATIRAVFRGVTGTAQVIVSPAPDVSVEPDSAFLVGEVGGADPVPDTLAVRNAGGATLSGLTTQITYTGQDGWLTADLSSSEDPADLILSAATAGLGVGTYQATVQVASPDDPTGPFDVAVLLTLTGLTVEATDGQTVVDESGTTDTVTVVLDAPPDSAVVLGITSGDPAEVSVSPDTLTFDTDNWDAPQAIVVTGVNDLVRDDDQTVTVTISVDDERSDPAFAPIQDRSFEVTNTDDDNGSFTASASGGSTGVDESGTVDDVSVVLDAQPLDTVVFRVTRSDTTEVAASPAILTFPPDLWNTPQTVTVQGVDDDIIDGTQNSYLRIVVDSARSDPAFIALGIDSLAVSTTDDDAAGFVVTATPPPSPTVDTTSVSESGTTDTILVVLGAEPATDVVFSVAAGDPGEVSVAPTTLTFAPGDWDVAQPVEVTGVDDLVLDGAQSSTITVSVVPASSDDEFDGLPPAVVNVTTLDDDVPGLTIVESGGGTATNEAGAPDDFTVALAAQPAGDVVIDLASDDLTEVTISPTRITIPAADWNVGQAITVTGVDERFDDGDRVVPVVLTVDTAASNSDYDLLAPDTVLVTNVDDDVAGFTLTQTAGGTLVTEGGSQDTVTVVLDARPIDPVRLTLLTNDTTEVSVAPALLDFDTNNWDVAQDIIVTGVDDGEPDGNQFPLIAVGVSGAFSDSVFANVADQTIQVTTINDDTVSVDVAPTAGLQTDEDGGTDQFTVVLGSQPNADVVVDLVSSEPLEGTVAPASLTFTSGNWDQPQVVTVTGVDDGVDDGTQPYTIQTSVTSGDADYAPIDPPDVSVSNIDNDAPPALSIDNVTVTEGDTGTVDAIFTVTSSIPSTQTVTIDWATADGSATVGDGDFDAASGTLTFLPGDPLTQTLTVTVNGDVLDEGASEAFGVVLTNPGNAQIGDANGSGTIIDDDGAPSVTIDDVTVTEGDAGPVNAVFTVTQSAASALTTSVNWNTADGTATEAGGDYVAGANTLTFAPGDPLTQQITVTVNGDVLDEGTSETFSVQLTGAVNLVVADPNGTGTITDDDDPPTLSVDDVTVTEGDAGTTNAVFTVTQSAPSGLTTTVNYATANGTAVAGPDYSPVSSVLSFAPGAPLTQTVTVVVVGDQLDEGASESFTLNLSGASNATILDGTGAGTITDDDAPPTISIGDVTVTEGDAGTVDATFTVTRSAPSGLPVSVDYTTADGTAQSGVDYNAAASTLNFAAGPGGPLSQTITVTVLGDLIDEGAAEDFTVELSNPGNATIVDGSGLGTITDDDGAPSLTISDVTIPEGDAGAANAIVTVTLTAESGLPVTVDYATADGTATAPGDYAATAGTLTFLPGDPLAQTIAVPVQGDVLDEGISEALTVELTNPSNATLADGSGTITISDDDAAPSLSIDDVTVTEGNVGTVNAVFTVTQSAVSGLDVTVDFTTVDGTAGAPGDYVATAGTLTFPAGGGLTQQITVTVNGDLIDEAAGEEFTVALSNASNAAVSDPSGTGTITDDDDPPTVSIGDVAVTEGDAGTVNAQLVVTQSVASSQTVTVDWATADGTATAGADYVGTSGTVTFLPGDPLTQNVTVQVNGDLLDEGASEVFTVGLTNPGNATLGDASGEVTITDDDDPPTLSIDDVTVTEGNGGTVNAIFTVTQSAASAQSITVDFATADGTATVANSDYDATSGTLTFDPGDPLTQTISVTVNGDPVDEGTAEAFTVTLTNAVNATLGDASGTGTIIDDDGTPTLFMDDVTVTEGDVGTVNAVFTVTKASNSGSVITVDFATADGTATAGLDYVATSGQLTFPAGPPESQTITIVVNGDLIDEGAAETFALNLSNPVNATILDPSETGTITDDDDATVSIDDVTVSEGDVGTTTASFTVTMSTPSSQSVTVDYASADGTATAGSDYTAVSGTLTFDPGDPLTQTVAVQVIGDAIDEGASETFTVSLSNGVNVGIFDPTGVGTITDDDDVPTLSVNDVTVTEGDAGTVDAVFTVSLSAASSQTIGVSYGTADGSASAGTDYVATSGSLTFLPGDPLTQTVAVTVNGDVLDEGAGESFFLSLSSASNATISDPNGLGTITDDDAPPTLSINDVTVTEGDAGTVNAVFTVTQSALSGQTVSVDYATADGSAEAGTDYVSTVGTLTFAPGSPLTRTITVVVSGDQLDEGASEDFTLGLANASNATIADGTGAGTITDDDAPPTLSINDVTVTEGDAGTVTAQFTVSQSAPSGLSVTVDYATQDGTATLADGDYDAAAGTLTFVPGGPLSQTVSVTVNGDVVDEGASETFGVVLSNAGNASLADPNGTGTITDDDGAPSLSIDDVNVGEGDVGTVNAVFTVTRTGSSSQTITVDYSTADGTANSATDYGATSGQLTFTEGGPATQTVTVAVNGDLLDEGISEAFTVNLTNAVNAVISDPSGTGTITDDDDPPTLSIDDVTVSEGDAGTVNAQFTVTQSAVSGQTVQVDWTTADGTATAGPDFVAASGTLSFAPGSPLTRTITVVVSGDVIDEGASEAFTVELSNAQNASITDASGAGTITDDDDATLSINDVTIQEGNAGTVDAVFTVTMSVPSSAIVSVDYATADGTATGGVDYVSDTGTLTFLPGDPITQTISITVNGDLVEEGAAETFTVDLSGVVNAGLTDASGLGTIVDDEGLPTLFVDDVSVVEGDAGTVSATFTVTQSTASAQSVTVDYVTADGTATAGADYASASGTLTFLPGDPLTQTVTVDVDGDVIDEGASETFTLELSNAANATIVDATGVGTITDDDNATLSIADVSVTEGDAGTVSAIFTVTKSIASTQSVSVSWATADGTAAAGSDYVAGSGALTFLPGDPLTQTITVLVNGDLLDEGSSEDFTVELSGPVNASITDGTGVGTITDDDDQPSLSVNDVSVTEGNTGGLNATFTVTLSAASSQTVSVGYATADGTATAGSDYVAASGSLNFIPGGSLSQTVSVFVNGDVLDEGISEAFSLNLSGATNATLADATGTGTILDDDSPPTLSIDDVTVTEGNAGTVSAVFTVSQSAASGLSVSVDYATSDGTAQAGTDYTATSGTLTFLPGGALTQTIAVLVSGDLLDEGISETFGVDLSGAVNASIADVSGLGTITDDDGAPSLSISDVTLAEGDAGTVDAIFTVTQSAASGQTVTVGFATQDGSASAGPDYTATSGSLTFLPGGALSQTITVAVNGDLLDEGSAETFTVQLSGASNASISDPTGVGTIIDDDGAPALTIGDVTVTEGDAGTTNAQFVVTLSAASGLTVSVDFATADGTAQAGADYVATSGTLDFLPGDPLTQNVTVVVNADLLDEGASEAFTVGLTNAVNGAITDPTGTGTITDDDGPPTISIGDATVTEGDAGSANAIFTITQSAASGLTTSVDWATADGTATIAGNDYLPDFGTVQFTPGGSLTQTVTVSVNGDFLDEGASETFTVNLSNPVQATLLDASGLGTITDDDAPPTISIGDVTVSEGNTGTVAAVFDVTLDQASGQTLSVDWATADGTATVLDSDYQAGSGTLTFAPGGPLTQQITVLVNGDLVDEGTSETFTVGLSNELNVTIGTGTGTGTIVDDEGPPSLRVDDVTVLEGDAGTIDAVFTVTLSAPSAQTVSVDYATSDGSATAGTDYVAVSGTLTFDPGDPLTQTVPVTVNGDVVDEGTSETFDFNLSNAVNATILDPSEIGTITDDDTATLTIDDVTVTEGNTGTTTAVFTVTQSVESTQPVIVNYSTNDGSATTANSDYQATSGTLTFLPGGSLTQQVSVTVNGDVFDEGASETFTVDLSGAINAAITDASGTGTINDDDGPPTISIDNVTVTEGNAGTVSAVFTVTQSAQSGLTTSVDFTTTDASATAGADYVATSGTLTWNPGDPLAQQISVTVNADLLDEGASETFTVDLSNVSNAVLGQATGTGTITDDDDPPSLAIDNVTVSEGDAGTVDAVFTVTMSDPSGLPVAVDFGTTDGSATVADGDYVAASGTLNFPAGGSLTQQITVTVNGDARDEGASEAFTVDLSSPSNATISDNSGTGTITDDDDPPTLSIDDVTVTEGDAGTVDAVFTVTQSAVSGLPVAVDFGTTDGSATVAGGDYDAISGTLNFPAGGVLTQTITVTVNGDVLDEGTSEDFIVNLSGASNATILDGLGVGAITDDDDAELTIDDVTVTEGDAGTVVATFTVTKSLENSQNVTVSYTTTDGTATVADGDYLATSGTLTFLAGDPLTQTITVTVNGDEVDEGASEAFTVDLSLAVNATIFDGTGLGTITDDDDGSITVTPTSGLVTTEGGGTAQFSIVLGSEPTASVTIGISSSDPGEGTPDVASVVFTAADWDTPQFVTVTGQDDTLADGDQAYTILTGAVVSGDALYSGEDPMDVAVTNQDDETAGFSITEIGGNTVTDEDGIQQNIEVVLDFEPESNVVFTITEDDVDDSELTLSVTTLTFTPADWDTPQNIQVTPLTDGINDGDQTITITIAVDDAQSANPFDGLSDVVMATINDIDPP